MDSLHHKRLPDFEVFDKITFEVTPRWKTSGLSGDEWRQHVEVTFWFKGVAVHNAGFRDMQCALLLAGAEWIRSQEPIPDKVIEIEHSTCDQPSCPSVATVRLMVKVRYSERGDKLDAADQYGEVYRQFCERHRRRGDCSREDNDSNYEPIPMPGIAS